jgi:hypothetical protein
VPGLELGGAEDVARASPAEIGERGTVEVEAIERTAQHVAAPGHQRDRDDPEQRNRDHARHRGDPRRGAVRVPGQPMGEERHGKEQRNQPHHDDRSLRGRGVPSRGA